MSKVNKWLQCYGKTWHFCLACDHGGSFLALLLLAATLSLWAPASSSAASNLTSITTAYCKDCVPFQFTNESGEPAGLIIELWQLWMEKTGIEVNFQPGSWDESLLMAINSESDAHAGLFYNEQRAVHLEYGEQLTTTETHYFIKKGLPPVNNISDLAAYMVGVLAFDYVQGFLEKRLPQDSIITYDSYAKIMTDLKLGRLRVFAADTPTGIYHLQKAGLGFGYEYPVDKPLYTTDWLVATAKGNTALLQVINKGFRQITIDERRAIEARWIAIH